MCRDDGNDGVVMFRNRINLRVARKQLGDMKSSEHKVVLHSLNIQLRSFDDGGWGKRQRYQVTRVSKR